MSWFKPVQYWIRRWPLAAYVLLVFGVEWLLFLVFQSLAAPIVALLIGSWLPNIGGVLITGIVDGRDGLRQLFSRVVRWRVGFKWYVIAWCVPMLITVLALSVYALSGNVLPASAPAAQLLPLLLFNAILGPLGEELGWRGTALPGLPPNNAPLLAFMLGAMALNFFMVWMFNHTHGSLIMPFLAHWAFNFTGSATGVYDVPTLFWIITGLWWIVAAAIIVFDWARITPRNLHPHLR